MGALRNPQVEPSLYDRDFYAWSQEMAERLRQRNAAALDWDNLAEEIQALARSDHRQLFNRTEVLLIHLLKWSTRTGSRPKSWKNTIDEQRSRLEVLLQDNPSLAQLAPEAVAERYTRAAARAAEQCGLPADALAGRSPFTPDQVLDYNYLPAGLDG